VWPQRPFVLASVHHSLSHASRSHFPHVRARSRVLASLRAQAAKGGGSQPRSGSSTNVPSAASSLQRSTSGGSGGAGGGDVSPMEAMGANRSRMLAETESALKRMESLMAESQIVAGKKS
jgi:hypothetical protein